MLEQLNHAVVTALQDYGLLAIFLLMLVESACIPVPAELTMLYAGYLVTQHDISLVGAIVAGVGGNVAGSILIWFVGAHGGRALLERHGRWVGVRTSHIHHADTWFERHGNRAVLIARCIPIVRTFISLPAGIARMPLGPFTLYTTIGCIPFVTGFALLGVALGPHWDSLHDYLHVFDAIVALVIVWFAVKLYRGRRAGTATS